MQQPFLHDGEVAVVLFPESANANSIANLLLTSYNSPLSRNRFTIKYKILVLEEVRSMTILTGEREKKV